MFQSDQISVLPLLLSFQRQPIVAGKPFYVAKPFLNEIYKRASGQIVKMIDEMRFIKVKSFNYHGRRFTVKPTEYVKRFKEINILD